MPKKEPKEKNQTKKSSSPKKEESLKKEKTEIKQSPKDEQEINEENLEHVVESLEDNSINEFLANQWRNVALDQMNTSPILNLETDLPKRQVNEEDETKIEYDATKLEDQGKYIGLEKSDYEDKHVSDQAEILNEQKRLYTKPSKMTSNQREENSQEIKYTKPEDTVERNYWTKKKFDV